MELKIRGHGRHAVSTFEDASRVYQSRRDASGLGASKFPSGFVWENGSVVAEISYNGRVWAPGGWTRDATPIIEAAR